MYYRYVSGETFDTFEKAWEHYLKNNPDNSLTFIMQYCYIRYEDLYLWAITQPAFYEHFGDEMESARRLSFAQYFDKYDDNDTLIRRMGQDVENWINEPLKKKEN